MLLLLINIVIVIVVGAILFYLIDKFVRDGRFGEPAQDPGRVDLPRGDPATAASDDRGEWALARELFGHQRFLTQIAIGGLPFARVARVIALLSTALAPVVRGEAGSREPRRAEEQ
jgi:hypothetical protein